MIFFYLSDRSIFYACSVSKLMRAAILILKSSTRTRNIKLQKIANKIKTILIFLASMMHKFCRYVQKSLVI